MELNIEKFSPKKAELLEVSKKYLFLEIKGIDDKQGYMVVGEARKDLKRKRVEIQKTGKELRTEAIAFQKAVIQLENELVAIIEPVEIGLKEMQDKIDLEKEKLQRLELLPERKERLAKIGVVIDDNFILVMDGNKFEQYFNEKNAEFLAGKERLIMEEKNKLAEAQRIEEAKKQARIEAEQRAKQELENAKQKAEFERQEALRKVEAEKQEALRKAEAEKQVIIDEQNRKEKARIEVENLKKQQEAEKIRLEKETQAKLEKQKKYQKFLKDNNYNEDEDYLLNKENKVILMRKIAEFIK